MRIYEKKQFFSTLWCDVFLEEIRFYVLIIKCLPNVKNAKSRLWDNSRKDVNDMCFS